MDTQLCYHELNVRQDDRNVISGDLSFDEVKQTKLYDIDAEGYVYITKFGV